MSKELSYETPVLISSALPVTDFVPFVNGYFDIPDNNADAAEWIVEIICALPYANGDAIKIKLVDDSDILNEILPHQEISVRVPKSKNPLQLVYIKTDKFNLDRRFSLIRVSVGDDDDSDIGKIRGGKTMGITTKLK